ncbi:MAG: pyridoxamine 5'-phosphate oxidase family protein [Bacteroidia bacterium]
MLGELNKQQIEQLLKSKVIGRIGIYADKRIYVVPVSYAYDGQYIYGHSKDGLKIKMMRKNPKVCFEVDTMLNMANWQSVISWGEFEEIKDPKEQKRAMTILVDRLMPLITSETAHPAHDLSQSHRKDTEGFTAVIFKIRLEEKTGRFEKR